MTSMMSCCKMQGVPSWLQHEVVQTSRGCRCEGGGGIHATGCRLVAHNAEVDLV